ncbi:hypothetical protein [Actinomadura monticuli]|uniref:Uncharacterized protein n=1 Tax=Actinomadura monticuli TaxID=3097367 RepID=A0ABV4Q4L3_9ACTN
MAIDPNQRANEREAAEVLTPDGPIAFAGAAARWRGAAVPEPDIYADPTRLANLDLQLTRYQVLGNIWCLRRTSICPAAAFASPHGHK